MTHVSHGAIQSQLGAIMDVLTKAAVAEILQLFDDGSAVMRLEISRHQSENADLKRKLVEVKAQLRSVQIRLKASELSTLRNSERQTKSAIMGLDSEAAIHYS